MPDWQKIVARRIERLQLPSGQKEEIAAELASHLEECYEERRTSGLSEMAAIDQALSEVCDWSRLNRRIHRAKREEGKMNDRTRHFWLPGLASFCAAVVCEALLARWSYHPTMLVSSHLTQIMYGLWLFAQLGCGGVGAYFSRRAGGTRSARLGAALFTSAIWLVALLGIVGTSLLARVTHLWYQDFGSIDLLMMAKAIVVMVVIPSFAMVVGALPFLSHSQEIPVA